MMFRRQSCDFLRDRMLEPRRFIQTLVGPRQVGKTTMIRQMMEELHFPVFYSSADNAGGSGSLWLMQQWQSARMQTEAGQECLLIIDEVQKIQNWSETVKQLWDEDTFSQRSMKVLLTGSSSLLIQQGLTESLAGRFEIIRAGHWSFSEMEAAFGFNAEEYVWFGGYPGSAPLIHDETRFKEYIRHSLIDTTISKDILMLTRVEKPALLQRLFELGTAYSSQILSYNKMIGQLQDAGNTTTLSHYMNLLHAAGIMCGLEKIYEESVRAKGSSPKIQVMNTAFISALSEKSFSEIKANTDKWGRVVESSIGAHLIQHAESGRFDLLYWKDHNHEVDFVIRKGDKIIGIEVKSGASKPTSGMKAFHAKFRPDKVLMVGLSGIHWKDFLKMDPDSLF